MKGEINNISETNEISEKIDEIKSANRKALPKFLLIMAILLIVGFFAGFFSSKYGIGGITGSLKEAGAFFGAYIAPWAMLIIATAVPIICVPIYRSAKKQIDSLSYEDEETYSKIDSRISFTIWISNAALIISYFFMAAAYSGGTGLFDDRYTTALFLISIISLIAVIMEVLVIGQKCVDATKRINPEKKASYFDMKFQKKWLEDCDEAEKILIGRCAFKAYSATNKVCALSAGLLAVGALLFDTGFLPSFAVCLIWIVNSSVYCREAIIYSKTGNKIL